MILSVTCEGLGDPLLNAGQESSRFTPSSPGALRRGSADWVIVLSLGGNKDKECPAKPLVHIITPHRSHYPCMSLGEGMCPVSHCLPRPKSLTTFPQGVALIYHSLSHPQQNPALASSLLPAKHPVPNGQHPHPHSLPELEDDASGHENNDDGDGNCDIELGVHT